MTTTGRKRKTKAERRVEVAKDVIQQLRIGRLIASSGTYFRAWLDNRFDQIDDDAELRDLINDKNCRVCALGGLFTADILKNNKFSIGRAYIDPWDGEIEVDDSEIRERLQKIFSSKQLQLIEAVFEGSFVEATDFSVKEQDKYEGVIDYFWDRYPNDSDRMRAIMLNIIRNKGLFVPPKHTLRS